MPENIFAWNLFWDSKASCGGLLSQLERIELTEYEAGELAIKLRVLEEKVNELDAKKIEQMEQEAKHASSAARYRNR